MKIELAKLLKIVKAADKSLNSFYGSVLDGPSLGNLQGTLFKLFKYPTADAEWAASTILAQYAERIFSKDILVTMISRLLSSKGEILAGVSPTMWDGHATSAVMLCTGLDKLCDPVKPKLKVYLKCLIGEPAGLDFEVLLSRAHIEYLLGKQLGLSYKTYNASAEFLTGCFFQCLVEEDTTGARIAEIKVTEKMKQLNRKLADARLSFTKCKTPQLECAFCGKTKKDCPLAVWKGK